jgi:hypothetical protein
MEIQGMDEAPQDRIKRLIRESSASNVTHIGEAAKRRGRSTKPAAAIAPAPTTLTVQGNGAGIVGNNNQVTIHVRPVARPRLQVTVAPNPNQINATQAFELQQLVQRVVQVSGKSHAQVWGAFRRKFMVPSYLLLPADQHEQAKNYLNAWAAAAEAREPAPVPDRKRLLARIHAEARGKPDLLKRVRDAAEAAFGTRSLSELDGGQLAQVLRAVR